MRRQANPDAVEFFVCSDLKNPTLLLASRYLIRDAAVYAACRLSKTVTPMYVFRHEGDELKAIAMAEKGKACWLTFCKWCGGPGHIGCDMCKDTGYHKEYS